jgi:hypothetical protein
MLVLGTFRRGNAVTFAAKELLDCVFLPQFSRTFGIHVFHAEDFVVGHFREMANETNQFPSRFIVALSAFPAEGGHAS